MIWREKRILLFVLAVLLLGNIAFFLTYRVQYQSRLDAMDERLAQAEGQLAQTRNARAAAEAKIQAFRKVEQDVGQVFNDHWSTRPRRLTLLIGEVKHLANASNAIPKTYTFVSEQEVHGGGTRGQDVALGANEVRINFSVDASYDQIRRMINLLELSQQFIIIQGVALTASDQNTLNLSLQLKTVFRDDEEPAEASRL